MKAKHIFKLIILFFIINPAFIYAQGKKSARLSSTYIKDNIEGAYIKVMVKFRENRQYYPVENLELNLYKITKVHGKEELDVYKKISIAITDKNGEAKFYLDNKSFGTNEQLYEVKIENDEIFKDKSDEITFKDANIIANVSQKDSLKTINIKLIDVLKNPVPNQYITVKLKRLFGLMNIGDEEFYKTDNNGEISIDIKNVLYSKNGKLEFIIKLDDSNLYGTIIEHLGADFGVVMESKDSFDERTMWATAIKAPIYVLLIPNLLLIGIWVTIVLLIFNLYRIYKNNN